MTSPAEYLADAIDSLFAQLPGVRDGDAEAIHDARVATRRIRGALPVVAPLLSSAEVEALRRTTRKAGRALGHARDTDVALALVEELERRTPRIASSLAALRCELLEQHAAARRRLLKKIDQLPWQEARATRHNLTNRFAWRRLATAFDPGLGGKVLSALGERAGSLEAAVAHSSGIYVAKRSHATRVAVKKLRYLLEIAGPFMPIRPRAIKLLKKTQDALGTLHDRDVLRKRAERMDNQTPDAALPILLQAECATLYSQYSGRRDALLAFCAELKGTTTSLSSSRRHARGAMIGAGAVAAAAWILTDRAQTDGHAANASKSVAELKLVAR